MRSKGKIMSAFLVVMVLMAPGAALADIPYGPDVLLPTETYWCDDDVCVLVPLGDAIDCAQEDCEQGMDVNGDGFISAGDAMLIMQVVVGLRAEPKCED